MNPKFLEKWFFSLTSFARITQNRFSDEINFGVIGIIKTSDFMHIIC